MSEHFVCEVCTYPSRVAHCDNPACLGNPTHSPEWRAELKRRAEDHRLKVAAEEARREYRRSLRRSGFTTAF